MKIFYRGLVQSQRRLDYIVCYHEPQGVGLFNLMLSLFVVVMRRTRASKSRSGKRKAASKKRRYEWALCSFGCWPLKRETVNRFPGEANDTRQQRLDYRLDKLQCTNADDPLVCFDHWLQSPELGRLAHLLVSISRRKTRKRTRIVVRSFYQKTWWMIWWEKESQRRQGKARKRVWPGPAIIFISFPFTCRKEEEKEDMEERLQGFITKRCSCLP